MPVQVRSTSTLFSSMRSLWTLLEDNAHTRCCENCHALGTTQSHKEFVGIKMKRERATSEDAEKRNDLHGG